MRDVSNDRRVSDVLTVVFDEMFDPKPEDPGLLGNSGSWAGTRGNWDLSDCVLLCDCFLIISSAALVTSDDNNNNHNDEKTTACCDVLILFTIK